MKNFPVLLLKPKRERSVLFRHPWIFSGAVARMPVADEGDIVEVQSADNKTLGFGFFSAKSQITCRMFEWNENNPGFEADYWFQKITTAYRLRQKIINFSHTNACRLIHAEGDFLPGIIIDIYNDVAVVQILIKGTEQRQHFFTDALQKLGYNKIFIKQKTSSVALEDITSSPGWVNGNYEGSVLISENNIKFKIDFEGGQKTGFFLDQRDNRALLQQFAKNNKVLNTFSYTGGFSVYALAGGATEVHSVDISAEAIKMANENAYINFSDAVHKGIVADCFDFLKDMPDNEYDIIILDPPAFAKHARAVENASRGYKQINLQAFRKIKPGGLVFTFSCSQNISTDLFRKIIFGAAADSRRNIRIINQLHQPADHPVNIYHPETEYLKGLLLYVE